MCIRDRLERSPDESDGRQRRLTLSTRGRQLLVEVEQIYAELEQQWAEVIGQVALEQTRRRVTNAMAVSYTHLDVYKRQVPEHVRQIASGWPEIVVSVAPELEPRTTTACPGWARSRQVLPMSSARTRYRQRG